MNVDRERAWFKAFWPWKGSRVAGEYAAIAAQFPHFVADIYLRGGVFLEAQPRTPGDPFGDGIREGRRQLALELGKILEANPQEIYALLDRGQGANKHETRAGQGRAA